VRPALDPSLISIGTVLIHKTIEDRPRNRLQETMKNDILVSHGVGPFVSR